MWVKYEYEFYSFMLVLYMYELSFTHPFHAVNKGDTITMLYTNYPNPPWQYFSRQLSIHSTLRFPFTALVDVCTQCISLSDMQLTFIMFGSTPACNSDLIVVSFSTLMTLPKASPYIIESRHMNYRTACVPCNYTLEWIILHCTPF